MNQCWMAVHLCWIAGENAPRGDEDPAFILHDSAHALKVSYTAALLRGIQTGPQRNSGAVAKARVTSTQWEWNQLSYQAISLNIGERLVTWWWQETQAHIDFTTLHRKEWLWDVDSSHS